MRRNKILVLALAGIILSVIAIGSASAATFSTPLNTYVDSSYMVWWEGDYPASETISVSAGVSLTLHNNFYNGIPYTVTPTSWTKSALGSWQQQVHSQIASGASTSGDNSKSTATGSGSGKQFNDYHEYVRAGGSYASTVFANLKYNVV